MNQKIQIYNQKVILSWKKIKNKIKSKIKNKMKS